MITLPESTITAIKQNKCNYCRNSDNLNVELVVLISCHKYRNLCNGCIIKLKDRVRTTTIEDLFNVKIQMIKEE